MPDKDVIEARLEQALASQGYTRSRQVGDIHPQILIFYAYGQANPDISEIGVLDGESDEPGLPINHFFNRNDMARLVGYGRVQARGGFSFSRDVEEAENAMRDERLYLTVSAFDVEAFARKEKKILWRTQISIYARRNTLAAALPTMLESAAPYFGTNTAMPVTVDDRLRRRAEVTIGEATVVPDAPAR